MTRRMLLPASFTLNAALMLAVLFVARKPGGPPTAGPAPRPQEEARAMAEASPAAGPFRWAQLESPDYRIYIANLRAIGCPEQTIREIISADVVDLFAPQREPLLAKLTSSATTPAERGQAEQDLNEVHREEAALIRRLFGISEPQSVVAGMEQPTSAPRLRVRNPRPAMEDTNVVMPLVFQSVDANALGLGADQLQIVNEVRELFLADLGSQQAVNSPEYRRRWQLAQKQADSLLDGLLGRQLTLKYRAEVENQSAAAGN